MVAPFLHNFFAQISKKTSTPHRIAEKLSIIWGISRGTAYKKMRGETGLSAEELFLAAEHFGISLDECYVGLSDRVVARYPGLVGERPTPKGFVAALLHAMHQMEASGREGLHVRYSTNEIPVFYYLPYPALTACKMYIWNQTAWDGSALTKGSAMEWMGPLLADVNFRANCLSAFDTYAGIPSEEFYPINMLDNTLNQLRFLRETRSIDKGFFDTVADELLQMVKALSEAAAAGRKVLQGGIPGASLTVYHNEMMYSNNLILLGNAQANLVFTTLDNPNYLVFQNDRVVGRIADWFERMQQKSVRISTDAERQRRRFFSALERRIEAGEWRMPGD
jgi:hypothetical protein